MSDQTVTYTVPVVEHGPVSTPTGVSISQSPDGSTTVTQSGFVERCRLCGSDWPCLPGQLAAANARIAELTAALTLAERALQAEQEKYDHILSCEACQADDGWCPDAMGHQIHADEQRLAILAAAATP